jgi:hypothetical protein
MNVDDLDTTTSYRLARVLTVLETHHNTVINFDLVESLDQLEQVYEAYTQKRSKVSESASDGHLFDADHQRDEMIQEAIHIFLSEIAPKRLNRSKQSS